MDRLWAMQVFVKVVEAGSFSGAARQLDLANASVTSCIRNLENHLRVTLLQRTTRHLHVTTKLLHAREGDAGLLVERVGFLRDGRAVEFCQSVFRGDTYDFVAELSSPSE